MVTTVKCPTCGKPVEWNNEYPWRPFCCERCKLIDLGEWASESHRIEGEQADDFSLENQSLENQSLENQDDSYNS